MDIISENWHNKQLNSASPQPLKQMEIVNFNKESSDAGNLRLVSDNQNVMPRKSPTQFVNFIFFRVHPDWRKLNYETKRVFKSEFQSVYKEFTDDLMLFSYSLVGFDAKAELMFWRIGDALDLIQEMTAKLYRTNLGSYLETADNYLSVTREMMFVAEQEGGTASRYQIEAGAKKYHFVYPCAKSPEWSEKSGAERDALIEENFMVGRKFSNIKIHLTHAFGFSEQEYIVSFETDEPQDFLALAEELRQTSASSFSLRGTPIYTCRQRGLNECLDALG